VERGHLDVSRSALPHIAGRDIGSLRTVPFCSSPSDEGHWATSLTTHPLGFLPGSWMGAWLSPGSLSTLSVYAHTPSFQRNNVVVLCVFDFTITSSFP
jgi:hypothetical protein